MATSIIQIDVKDEQLTALEERIRKLRESVTRMSFNIGGPGGAKEGSPESHKQIASSMTQQNQLLQSIVHNMTSFTSQSKEAANYWKSIAASTSQMTGGGGGSGGGGGGGGGGASLGRGIGMIAGGYGALSLGGLMRFSLPVAIGIMGGALAVSAGSAIASAIKSTLGFGFALGGMGGNLFGLDRLAAAGYSGLRSSVGLGLSFGQMQASRSVFGTVFDPNSMLGSISRGRGDITSDQATALMSLGISPSQGNTGDTMLAVRQKARDLALSVQSESMLGPLLQSRMLDKFGLTVEDLRRFRGQSKEDFDKDTALAREQQRLTEVSPDMLRRWQQFHVMLGMAGQRIESSFIKGLDKLSPLLTTVSDGLSKAIETLIGSKGFEDVVKMLSAGLQSFADYIARGDLAKDMQRLSIAVSDAVTWIGGAVDWVKRNLPWITSPLSTATNAAAGAMGASPSTAAKLGNAASSALMANPLLNPFGFLGAVGNLFTGKANAADMSSRGGFGDTASYADPKWNQYIKSMMGMGWSYEQAVGIVANLKEESGGNPYAIGDQGKAFGLAQWHPDRQAQFKSLFGYDMRQGSAFDQLRFIDWELRNTERGAGNAVASSSTSQQAKDAFLRLYERPSAENVAARSGNDTAYRLSRAHPRDSITRVDINISNQTPASVNVTTAASKAAQ